MNTATIEPKTDSLFVKKDLLGNESFETHKWVSTGVTSTAYVDIRLKIQ